LETVYQDGFNLANPLLAEKLDKGQSVKQAMQALAEWVRDEFQGAKWSAASEIPQPNDDTLEDSFCYGSDYAVSQIREAILAGLEVNE
jgi:hypothetical protein